MAAGFFSANPANAYVLTDGKGNFIRRDEATNKYVPVRSFKQALRWEDPGRAESVLQNSVAKSIRKNYSVRECSETETEMVEKNDLQNKIELIYSAPEDDDVQEWLSKLASVTDVLSNTEARISGAVDKLSKVDKEISDIQHYIEFGQFNCYQGWLCFKILQNKLRQRRKYKNEISVLNIIRHSRIDTEGLSSLSKTISDSRKKVYSPRVLTELFKDLK